MEIAIRTSFTFLTKVSVSLREISLTHVAQYIFVDVSCTDLYPNRKKSAQYTVKFHPLPQHSKTFTTPIFVKLVNAECHQVWIFYTKFHPNRSRNMEITLKCSFAPFCILQHDGQFARSPPVFFLSKSFATVRKTAQFAWSPHTVFSFLLCNERPRKIAHGCNTAPLPPYLPPHPCRNPNSHQSFVEFNAKRTGSQQVSVAVVVRRPLRLC